MITFSIHTIYYNIIYNTIYNFTIFNHFLCTIVSIFHEKIGKDTIHILLCIHYTFNKNVENVKR